MEETLKQILSAIKEIKSDVSELKSNIVEIKESQSRMEKKLDIVHDQTAFLTEFRTETNEKLDYIIEDSKAVHGLIGEHEVSMRVLRKRPV